MNARLPQLVCHAAELQSQHEMSPQLDLSGSGNSLRMSPFIQLPVLYAFFFFFVSDLSHSSLWMVSCDWHLHILPGSWFDFFFWHPPPVFIVTLHHSHLLPAHPCSFRRRDDTWRRGAHLLIMHRDDMIIRDLIKNDWCISNAYQTQKHLLYLYLTSVP